MRYENEEEIVAVIRGFEDATISRDDWKHAEHLTVGLYYLTRYDLETATKMMRDGIFKLLAAFKVDLTKEMPYHETLTVFWMQSISDFIASRNGISMLDKANELVANYDKDYPFLYYSRERLFSDEARTHFVLPDK